MAFLLAAAVSSCYLAFNSPSVTHLLDKEGVIVGSCGDDELEIPAGRHYINGRKGNDVIILSSGEPAVVQGGSGNDVIYAGTGNDQLFGGYGYDTFIFEGPFGKDVIKDLISGRGDRLVFVSYASELQNAQNMIDHYLHEVNGDTVIDLSQLQGFDGAVLTILSQKPKDVGKNIQIRYITPAEAAKIEAETGG